MGFIKDTSKLISLLFTSPKKTDDVVLYQNSTYPAKGYAYMMWCGHLFFRDKKLANITAVSKRHETIHLMQAKDKGSWIWYYLSYFWEYLKGWPVASHAAAYYTSKYEVEAYAKQTVKNYVESRPKNAVNKFKIKSRLQTFKQIFDKTNKIASLAQWKLYIRTLF